ncbi:MAG: hypothetical protein AB7O86_05770 [Porticoccaceae bacterium]
MSDITNTTPTFEDKVLDLMTEWLPLNIDGVEHAVARPLSAADPNGTIGVFFLDWMPVDDTIGQWEPEIGRYSFAMQVLIKHSDEVLGRALHGNISKSIRSGLYHDQGLRVSFGQLSIVGEDALERFLKLAITRQSSANNEDLGQFVYLGMTEFYVDTSVAVL